MKIIIIILMLYLLLCVNAYADSDGYVCYGHGIVAWDQGFSDPTGLYVVQFGNGLGISDVYRVELPRRHGSYSQGIDCEENKVTILMRGQREQKGDTLKYLMYLTEISIMEETGGKIISDKPNHYQIWKSHRHQQPEIFDDEFPIVLLDEADFRLDDCQKMDSILLETVDSQYSFYLNFDYSYTSETYEHGGVITHRCITTVQMRDANENLVQSFEIADRNRIETID